MAVEVGAAERPEDDLVPVVVGARGVARVREVAGAVSGVAREPRIAGTDQVRLAVAVEVGERPGRVDGIADIAVERREALVDEAAGAVVEEHVGRRQQVGAVRRVDVARATEDARKGRAVDRRVGRAALAQDADHVAAGLVVRLDGDVVGVARRVGHRPQRADVVGGKRDG